MGQISATVERACHLIGLYLDATVSELGITQAEAHVLAHVSSRGPTAIAALHHEFGHKRSTLTNVVDRLERRKLVRRELNPKDRRSFVIHLTPSGRRTGRRVTSALDELERDVAASVAERDLAGLRTTAQALEKVTRQRIQRR